MTDGRRRDITVFRLQHRAAHRGQRSRWSTSMRMVESPRPKADVETRPAADPDQARGGPIQACRISVRARMLDSTASTLI